MKLIVGLGNPDIEYQNTFHNLGFMSIDNTASLLGVEFNKEKFHSLIAESGVGKDKVILCKPLTYMNLSGTAVKEIVDFYKIPLNDLMVIYDDFDLNKGHIRIREFGSAGTHNGMRNIVKELNSENFPRVRVGFKPEGENNIPLLNLVLSGISKEDAPVFKKATLTAGKCALDFINGVKIQDIMQKYNGLAK